MASDGDVVQLSTAVIPEPIQYLIGIVLKDEYDGIRRFEDKDVAMVKMTPYDGTVFPYLRDVEHVYIAFRKGVIR